MAVTDPNILLSGRGPDFSNLTRGITDWQAVEANKQQLAMGEAQAAAAKRQKEMQGLTAITNSLAYLDQMPDERKPAALENIKRFARTAFDDPNGYIEQITLENLPQIRAAITPYMTQLQEGLAGAKIDTQNANTGLVYAKTNDIGIDNQRADWKTGADIANANQRTALYGSGIANANANRDAMTGLAYTKAERTGYGQLPDGYVMGADGAAQMIPGYTAQPTESPMGKAPSGYQWQPDGTLAPIKGGPADKSSGGTGGVVGKLTEGQEKTVVYGNRAARAADQLESIDSALTNYWDAQGSGLPLGIGNQVISEDYQKARQYAEEFLSAVLRKDTGAAITEQEMQIYGRTYLPQPGDSAEVLQQKRMARRQAVEDLKRGLGDRGSLIEGGSAPSSGGDIIEYDAEGNPL